MARIGILGLKLVRFRTFRAGNEESGKQNLVLLHTPLGVGAPQELLLTPYKLLQNSRLLARHHPFVGGPSAPSRLGLDAEETLQKIGLRRDDTMMGPSVPAAGG